MNAKFLKHIVNYRETQLRIETMKIIIHEKVNRQMVFIKKYHKNFEKPTVIITGNTDKQVMLCEARYAKIYWKYFSKTLPLWIKWCGRKPHHNDIVNKLLDIGYHTLVTIIQKKCNELDIPTEIGLLHTAQSSKAHPLVYDIMECFRVIIVDEILIKFLHMKKEPITEIDLKIIAEFLHDVYEKLSHEYYHKERKVCLKFSYWIDLVLLELRGTISEQRTPTFHFTPIRHENRCNKKSPHLEKN